ncbi:hypothetical protein H4R35_007492 [Dimargaris xerosporica]|nr:hypothetical protein H4R35_007492 [Dimargaris xerosporica]
MYLSVMPITLAFAAVQYSFAKPTAPISCLTEPDKPGTDFNIGPSISNKAGALMEPVSQTLGDAWISGEDLENGAVVHKSTLQLQDICRLAYFPESWTTDYRQCILAETTPFGSLPWASDSLDQQPTCVNVEVDDSAVGICNGEFSAEASVPVVVVTDTVEATPYYPQNLADYIKLGLKEYKAARHYPYIYMMCLVGAIRLAETRGIEFAQRLLLCALTVYTNAVDIKAAASKIREAYYKQQLQLLQ